MRKCQLSVGRSDTLKLTREIGLLTLLLAIEGVLWNLETAREDDEMARTDCLVWIAADWTRKMLKFERREASLRRSVGRSSYAAFPRWRLWVYITIVAAASSTEEERFGV